MIRSRHTPSVAELSALVACAVLGVVAGLLALQVGISATLVSQLGTDGAALAFLAINVVSGIASTLCVWRWFMRGERLGQALLPQPRGLDEVVVDRDEGVLARPPLRLRPLPQAAARSTSPATTR